MPTPVRARRIPVTTSSDGAREHLERGRLAAFHYRFERARHYLDAAIEADPDMALAYVYRGGSTPPAQVDQRRRYSDRALALRDRVSDGERRMIDAFRLFLLHDDDDHAIEIFRELSDEYTDDPIAPAHLGLRTNHAKERFGEAAEQFERARERDPGFAPVHAWLGRALLKAGRSAEAEATFLEGLGRFPEDADCHRAIGAFYVDQERLYEAVRHFERALEIDPSFEEAREALDGARGRRQGA